MTANMKKSIFNLIWFLTLLRATFANIRMVRTLTKSGFHRDVETTLYLPKKFVKDCRYASILIFESLPSGVYADPYQLKSLEQFGGPQVLFGDKVDIEAAEFISEPLELFTFLNMSSFSDGTSDNFLDSKVVLPIHARYHQPSTQDTHVDVMILNPGVYTNCTLGDEVDTHTLSAPCDPINSLPCTWSHLPYESKWSHLTMAVPVGQGSHKPLVIVITLLVSVAVSVILAKIIISYQHKDGDKVV